MGATKCDKKFKTAAALRGHFVVHSPSRPFKCNINDCTKDFRSKKLLKNHMEEFHNLTDKKYACEFEGCEFAFFKRSHLERHKITHTGIYSLLFILILIMPFMKWSYFIYKFSRSKSKTKISF